MLINNQTGIVSIVDEGTHARFVHRDADGQIKACLWIVGQGFSGKRSNISSANRSCAESWPDTPMDNTALPITGARAILWP